MVIVSTRGTTNLGNLSSKLSIDDEDFSLAGDQSYGLLDGISNQAWKRLQNRVRTRNNHKYPNNPYEFKDQANQWYQHNFEPDFTCLYEERVGGNGDGPKWVCNPQRLNEISIERHSDLGHGCLIYSFGNPGDFSFEEGMAQFFLDDTGDNNFLSHSCEIHMFDVDDYSKTLPDKYKDIIHIHRWGLKSSSTPTNDRALSIYSIDDVETNNLQDGSSKLARTKESQVYRTFQETIDKLGHKHRIIDVLKVDCERCEWDTYADWLAADVEIRQI
jgi:hypothetical protein